MRAIDRLSQYIDYKLLTNASFEKAAGLSNGYIRKLKGGKGSIGSDVLEKIAITFIDLSLYWIITGKGEMLQASAENVSSTSENDSTRAENLPQLYQRSNMYEVLLTAKNETIAGLRQVIEGQKELIAHLQDNSHPKKVFIIHRTPLRKKFKI